MEKKVNIPQKGAGRKWAKRLKELGQQKPPKDLVDKINKAELTPAFCTQSPTMMIAFSKKLTTCWICYRSATFL